MSDIEKNADGEMNADGAPAEAPMDIETARRVMQERLTRRQALRKFGFGAGMAAIALLSTDDLVRMVGKKLEQIAGDNKIANQLAKEFQQAGVAFAAGPQQRLSPSGPCTDFENDGGFNNCIDCNNERYNYCKNTAHCSDLDCNTADNCGTSHCGPNTTYQELQNCWSSICSDCLATCD